jgi:O-methyltransferase involved in polyketide biosynthesis
VLVFPFINRDDALFADPYAHLLCSPAALEAVPESRSFNAMRTKFFDDSYVQILTATDITQVCFEYVSIRYCFIACRE